MHELSEINLEQDFIFCDASFHPQHKFGMGGFLSLTHQDSPRFEISTLSREFINFITIENTNNIRVEVATVLAALTHYQSKYAAETGRHRPLLVFSDCKNVCELSQRRQRLEANQFQSARRAAPLANSDLYRQFYDFCDALNPQFIWLKGHTPSQNRTEIQTIFAYLDKTVRQELRVKVKALDSQPKAL